MTFDAKDRETAILFLSAIALFLLVTHFWGA